MPRNLARFLELDQAARRGFARAFMWLTVIDIALRLPMLGHHLRRAWMVPSSSGNEVDATALRQARRFAYWIALASRHHVVRARCLHRSLVLHLWLRAEGLPSRLQIGVRKDGDQLRAHAWVELGDSIVNDVPEVAEDFALLAPVHGEPVGQAEGRGFSRAEGTGRNGHG